mmetsp:Transcript_11793/g.14698  ORF Transcript_11793/g.14698 Transcript_11793/m.14698 type:complete len:332 (+) Transcript_11793:115-1110(+)|eukprot:CAMPEP_0172505710 /NCGR_PEP_ID=MMETSP1066-20121228/188455_1 /TAXON_ID=671091 /ORGANISM="Coscinodiscus wailesii, Strain CCMP2513" /LENGTH=331 /DNA_ID=CAMNT_0013282427 /DNA_START=88 /DNA_END=1083 /DNA_ORIENTATION=-
MNSRRRIGTNIGLFLALTTKVDAFNPTPLRPTNRNQYQNTAKLQLSSSGAGPASNDWRNDDFLASLSGTPEDRDAANHKYYNHAEMLARMRGKSIEVPEQYRERSRHPPTPQPVIPPPYRKTPDPERPNPDGDVVSNMSNAYFSRLGVDSRLRKRAFLSGDMEASNRVFHEQRIIDLEGVSEEEEENPTLTRNGDAKETEEAPTTNTPISYREKLAEAKRNKNAGGGAGRGNSSGSNYQPSPATTTTRRRNETPPSVPPQSIIPPPSPAPVTAVAATPAVVSSLSSNEDLVVALEYAESVIKMYDLAPGSQKASLRPLLRTALIDAVEKLN